MDRVVEGSYAARRAGVRAGTGLCVILGLLFVAPVPGAAAEAPVAAPTAPPGFGVEPFRNLRRARALDHMTFGLPAFIAERLANTAKIRFESLPDVFPRLQPAAARY